jgi:hypothetical protein
LIKFRKIAVVNSIKQLMIEEMPALGRAVTTQAFLGASAATTRFFISATFTKRVKGEVYRCRY